jgi:hypothetical protein
MVLSNTAPFQPSVRALKLASTKSHDRFKVARHGLWKATSLARAKPRPVSGDAVPLQEIQSLRPS